MNRKLSKDEACSKEQFFDIRPTSPLEGQASGQEPGISAGASTGTARVLVDALNRIEGVFCQTGQPHLESKCAGVEWGVS